MLEVPVAIGSGGETLVARTARRLSALSLANVEGAYLGAEDELLARLGVSRPTLRQAAKIAESECLISVRRGLRGGFFATRPDANDAIRTLNRYLRVRGATLREVTVVSRHVTQESVSLAAKCNDESLRTRLEEFLQKISDCDSAKELMVLETQLEELIAQMSGNVMLELMVAMVFSFGWEEQGISLYQEPAQRTVARGLLCAIIHAILERDGELARLMARRRSAKVHEWILAADASQLVPIREV